MAIDYASFKTKSWSERIGIFNAVSADEKAELVRTHISWWLATRREALNADQIAILEESIAAVVPELYVRPTDPDLMNRFESLMKRTALLLSGDQMRQALTMHWRPGEWD